MPLHASQPRSQVQPLPACRAPVQTRTCGGEQPHPADLAWLHREADGHLLVVVPTQHHHTPATAGGGRLHRSGSTGGQRVNLWPNAVGLPSAGCCSDGSLLTHTAVCQPSSPAGRQTAACCPPTTADGSRA